MFFDLNDVEKALQADEGFEVINPNKNGNVVLLDPFKGWANPNKKSGEYKSVSDIEAIYGSIQRAAAYSKL